MSRIVGGALFMLVALALVAWFSYRAGYSYADSKHLAQRELEWANYNASLQSARAREQALHEKANKIQKEAQREAATLNANIDVLIGQLRNRPKRPQTSGVPQTPGAESEPDRGCTGAELYSQDAEFLLREAAQCDTIRIAAKQCVDQYNSLTE